MFPPTENDYVGIPLGRLKNKLYTNEGENYRSYKICLTNHFEQIENSLIVVKCLYLPNEP